ncbi:ABC transporter permease [Roseomonas elaeocarpi]|uniref:ABC transporter permease n=1 Tax=Roseomonas elaeocarpi TaxID=907779 RepID=A0ABV6JZ71_9PROT
MSTTTATEAPVILAPRDLTPRQLMWLRFRRHHLAMAGLAIVVLIYLLAAFAEFLSPMDPERASSRYALHPPQSVTWFESDDAGWRFRPSVQAFRLERDRRTLQARFVPDPGRRTYLRFFAEGDPYRFWGLFPGSRHLLAPERPGDPVFLVGADRLGRDMLSRTLYGARISMTVGLVGVALSLILGIGIGGVAGYYGGRVDWVVQRLTEYVISLPTIPVWMALAAAVPRDWPPLTIYFLITLIVSLIGWTELARVVRGRFLSLRTEDFVTAARIDGCSEGRVIFRHMLPSFASHIIASVTLAIPLMILAETSLSFLGLGLQPPTISWGVLLKEAQNVRSIAAAPWLFLPGAAVVLAVLALNFLGDGLRDAADPHA